MSSGASRQCRIKRGGGTGPSKPRQPSPAGKVLNPAEPPGSGRCEPATWPDLRIPMYATHLVCKGCSAEYPLDARFACDRCFGPLEAAYDREAIAAAISRESVAQGPHTLWRWSAFLPVAAPSRGLPVGNSPLIRADRLARELGLSCRLHVKTETSNPTHSFK